MSDTSAEIMEAKMPFTDPLFETEAWLSPGFVTLEIKLGARIHRRRRELGIELTRLSDGTGVPVIRLTGIEAGFVRPSAPEVYDIATALDVTITELFKDAIPASR